MFGGLQDFLETLGYFLSAILIVKFEDMFTNFDAFWFSEFFKTSQSARKEKNFKKMIQSARKYIFFSSSFRIYDVF